MKLLGEIKNKRYYTRLILWTAIIALVPIIVLSTLSYVGIKRNMETQLNDTTQIYLKQCENAIDIVLKQVGQSMHQLTIDADFKEYENFYNGSYYEAIRGGFKEEDLPMLYNYLTKKAKILDKLNVYRSANNFVDSVYFYDTNKNIVLTDNKFEYKFEDFYDQAWFGLIKDIEIFPIILDTRIARQYDNQFKDVISIVYKTVNAKDNNNFIVINIDQNYLFNSLSNEVQDQLGRAFFILSKDNKAIIKAPDDYTYQSIVENKRLEDYLQSDIGMFKQQINHKKYIVNFIKNDVLNWTFVTTLGYDEFYKTTNAIRNLLIIFTVLIGMLTMIVVVISSKRMYKPILNIVNFIKSNIRGDEPRETSVEDIDYINNSIRMVYDNYMDICDKLDKNLPDYKERFMYFLLQYNRYTYDEIVEKMNFIGIDLDTRDLVVIVVNIEYMNYVLGDVSKVNDDISSIKAVIEDSVNQHVKGIVLYGNLNKFTIVLNANKEHFKDIFRFSENLKNELKKEVHIRVSLGISKICENITNLSQAYKEANEALKYRDISNHYDVIYIDQIKIRNRQFMTYPKENVEVINSHLRMGNKKEALDNLNEMIDGFMVDNKYTYYSDIQKIFIRFLNSINSTLNELGLELNDIFPEENVYQTLLQMNTIDEIKSWSEKIIVEISDYIISAVDDKKNKYIEEINTYLEGNPLKDITLSTVAEHLALNPSYVSKMFKEHIGKGFTEYLTDYKVKKSKELLVNTDLKIQDICTEMGYSNSYYFIKIFKKYTGLTPGEYRKAKATM